MNKLISLELKRNSLRSYHVAALIGAVGLLALLYLFAAIPKLDPMETGLDMFMSYRSLIGLTNIIGMVIFAILSAVMSAKFIVEEYAGIFMSGAKPKLRNSVCCCTNVKKDSIMIMVAANVNAVSF